MKSNFYLTSSSLAIFMLACCAGELSSASDGLSNKAHATSTTFKAEPQSAESETGKKLAARQNCATCHSVEGKGGSLAPPFDGIGARRTRAFMVARLSSERQAVDEYRKLNPQGELFAHARVPAQQANSLVSYLLTIAEPAGGFEIAGHQVAIKKTPPPAAAATVSANSQSIRQGKALFIKRNCLSCHSVGGGGGQFAPTLDGIGKRAGRDSIVATLTANETYKLTESDKNGDKIVMSPAAFSPSQIQKVADFLMTLPETKTESL